MTLQKQFHDQSRRCLLAAPREGRLEFAARAERCDAGLAAGLDHDAPVAVFHLRAEILSGLSPGPEGAGGCPRPHDRRHRNEREDTVCE